MINHPVKKDNPVERDSSETARPIFISEILTRNECAAPLSILLDLDNAGEGNPKTLLFNIERGTELENLRRRTGTPRFVARAVAAGHALERSWNASKPMPSLPSKLFAQYKKAHSAGSDPLRRLEDRNGTIHGVPDGRKKPNIGGPVNDEYNEVESSDNESSGDEFGFVSFNRDEFVDNEAMGDDSEFEDEGEAQKFQHLPRHDAESVFWVIVVFLLRALPRGERPQKDKNSKGLLFIWDYIASHEIMPYPGKFPTDDRTTFLNLGGWEHFLHAKLGRLVPMMEELVMQVKPEYSHLPTPPDDLHLHEAMQRILLKYSVKFAGASDIPLDAKRGRVVHTASETKEF
ncbi:hypothetical protein EYR36_009245 [Pleurotus pulmonarius]|nr:hypothetical protein EYR36_009245 [Pleurotus pulmonarius]